MNSKPIQNITADNFQRYGVVLDFSPGFPEVFEIIVKQPDTGWRLALLRYGAKTARTMERHPGSKESFEPLSGMFLMIVAEAETPADFEVFLLDRPVCLHAGVWHQVISLAAESQVKITENLEVDSEYYEFPTELTAGIIY